MVLGIPSCSSIPNACPLHAVRNHTWHTQADSRDGTNSTLRRTSGSIRRLVRKAIPCQTRSCTTTPPLPPPPPPPPLLLKQPIWNGWKNAHETPASIPVSLAQGIGFVISAQVIYSRRWRGVKTFIDRHITGPYICSAGKDTPDVMICADVPSGRSDFSWPGLVYRIKSITYRPGMLLSISANQVFWYICNKMLT